MTAQDAINKSKRTGCITSADNTEQNRMLLELLGDKSEHYGGILDFCGEDQDGGWVVQIIPKYYHINANAQEGCTIDHEATGLDCGTFADFYKGLPLLSHNDMMSVFLNEKQLAALKREYTVTDNR